MFLKAIFLAVVYFICSGLTFYEASALYGSNILLCSPSNGDEKTVRYWSLVKKYPKKKDGKSEDIILDLLSRKSFKIGDCTPFECSPEPGRLKDCKLK